MKHPVYLFRTPHMITVAFHRRGRRIVSKVINIIHINYPHLQIFPWLPSPDNPLRGIVVWPEPETVEAAITLYKVTSLFLFFVIYFIRGLKINHLKLRSGSFLLSMYVNATTLYISLFVG